MTDGYGDAGALLPALATRVPALTRALDVELAARHLERTLLRPGGEVHRVTPGALWYRSDGSCSLRHRVTVSLGTTGATEHTVLARLYPSGDGADRSVASGASPSTPVEEPPSPWRRWSTQAEAADTSLSLFPADPELPTLAAAMDLSVLSPNDWPCPTAEPTSVELVHHSRQGPAVLHYGVRWKDSSASPLGEVYGKVYPDRTTGQRVHRFLESVPRPGRVRVPMSLGYSSGLNLGLTEALPGRPVLPGIVRSAVQAGSDAPSATTGHSAYEAVHASGQALAALHSIRYATAPEVTARHLIRDLEFQLTLVQQVWPEIADDVRSRLDRLEIMDRLADGVEAGAVLSHGDFTPSQVLFAGDTVCGVVDFDTVCWGEEAMDLGRFLAQLDLVVTKDAGRSADHLRDRLAEGFVSGYAESAGVAGDDESLRERVGLFRSLSLASTALHACRQLKQRRLNLALSLLSLPTYNSRGDPLESPQIQRQGGRPR